MCLNGLNYHIEFPISFKINEEDYFNVHKSYTTDEYILHLNDENLLLFHFDSNFRISYQHQSLSLPSFVPLDSRKDDLHYFRNHFCATCLMKYPIQINDSFLKKFKKYKSEFQPFFYWNSDVSNLNFVNNRKSNLIIYSQLSQNGSLTFKKRKVQKLLKHNNCQPSLKKFVYGSRFNVIMHQCEKGYVYRIIDLKNNIDRTFEREHAFPFDKLSSRAHFYEKYFWLKNCQCFMKIAQRTDFITQTVCANETANFELSVSEQIFSAKLCEFSNQLLLYTNQGIIIYDLKDFLP